MAGKMLIKAAGAKQGDCMGSYGTALLFGTTPGITQDHAAAMPLLLESARHGYYHAAWAFFSVRHLEALRNEFGFTDEAELERAICWGRLAEQHTNWAGFDHFLGQLRDYARKNNRPDLVERSKPFDPRIVPITQTVVKPEDCIQLEKGE